MKKFDYNTIEKLYLNTDIVSMLNTISEYKGKEQIYNDIKKDILDTLI